jgi:MOSC domain-containing protein YiiM
VTDGRVVGLHRIPSKGAVPERLAEAVVRTDWGVEGDRHARPGSSRQVVLVQSEVLDALRLGPGVTREQLTVSGLGSLAAGDVLVAGRAGAVRLELVRPRVPCRVMDRVRPGLMAELQGRGGWCARVLAGGTLRPGDVVTVERAATEDPPWLADYLAALAAWEAGSPSPPAGDGWATFAERLAHLVAWDQRGAERIEALAGGASQQQWGPTDIDAFNAAAVDRLRGADLWVLHDDWSTAVVDAARRWPALAEPWVRSLTKHYREHT